ncbi:MAG: inverse autotransporter beta domain-containing protein, partial [Parachlamydiaceae bacterium]|nr:inverse autotransporter beta domain-containing protein [Parachlamydiaceae bacterium]
MNSRNFYIFTFLIILQSALSADESSDSALEEPTNGIHFRSLRRNEGSALGEVSSYNSLEAFSFSCNYQNFYPFVDLRCHGFGEKCQNAANMGVGFRFAPYFTKAILGANVYCDYRNYHDRSFNQIGIGFESLGPCLNFRFNAYLPLGENSRVCSSKYCAKFPGGYYIKREIVSDSLKG